MLCGWHRCVILVAVSFLEVMQQRLPAFAEVESPISVNVIWMQLNFDGFSDETIHVAGFLLTGAQCLVV